MNEKRDKREADVIASEADSFSILPLSNVSLMRLNLLDPLFTSFNGLQLIDTRFRQRDIFFSKTAISSISTSCREMISLFRLSFMGVSTKELDSRGFSISINLTTEHSLPRTEARFSMRYGWGIEMQGHPIFLGSPGVKEYRCDGRQKPCTVTVETNQCFIVEAGTLSGQESFLIVVEIEGGFATIHDFTARMKKSPRMESAFPIHPNQKPLFMYYIIL